MDWNVRTTEAAAVAALAVLGLHTAAATQEPRPVAPRGDALRTELRERLVIARERGQQAAQHAIVTHLLEIEPDQPAWILASAQLLASLGPVRDPARAAQRARLFLERTEPDRLAASGAGWADELRPFLASGTKPKEAVTAARLAARRLLEDLDSGTVSVATLLLAPDKEALAAGIAALRQDLQRHEQTRSKHQSDLARTKKELTKARSDLDKAEKKVRKNGGDAQEWHDHVQSRLRKIQELEAKLAKLAAQTEPLKKRLAAFEKRLGQF